MLMDAFMSLIFSSDSKVLLDAPVEVVFLGDSVGVLPREDSKGGHLRFRECFHDFSGTYERTANAKLTTARMYFVQCIVFFLFQMHTTLRIILMFRH